MKIYAAAFGGGLFMTHFYRAGGGGMPPLAPLDPLLERSTDRGTFLSNNMLSILLF